MKVAGKGKRRVPSSGEATGKRTAGRARAALWKGVLGREGRPSSALSLTFFPKQELLGSPPQKKKERAWRDGWHTARELGAAEFGWVARSFGAGGLRLGRGPRSWMGGTRLWFWMAGTQLWSWGRTGWMGGMRLRSWGPAWSLEQFGWVAGPRHAAGAGGPQSLEGWLAAQELGELRPAEFGWVARGFGAGRPRF